ncbi:hypothetical protein [Algoriphagus terrigena]|uniref:hypothetical protein n=1 Tax=Algoriphagus terrigena TaxID=344884 RepID=UPI00042A2304|nr:hypothetical protein [Algoriphagus terrigena]
MQEDKSSKWLADQLRKQQEENQLPYELGAWEAFEAKRSALAKKKTNYYWISGIAAALTLLVVAGGLWISQETTESGSPKLADQIALQEKAVENSQKEVTPITSETEVTEARELPPQNPEKSEQKKGTRSPLAQSSLDQPTRKAVEQPTPNPVTTSTAKVDSGLQDSKSTESRMVAEQPIKAEVPVKEEAVPTIVGVETFVATNDKTGEEKASRPEDVKPQDEKKDVALAVVPKDPQLSDEEIKEILETKSFASIAMGVSPGFGSSSGSEQATSGSSVGLGVMVDMEVTGKLIMGSGLAVNYLNQASESQNYNYGGANALALTVTETDEIKQVQVDIPLYVKYPITRNRAISVQAGFSNLITFNQGAEQESSYTRQVAVYDAMASSSFRLQSESVTQSQDLNVPNQKFYPFATANLGVNIRLFQAKKTSYEVMPFYNYPLQEFSGYGEKLGMFGASFKVNFGAMQGK